MLGSDLRAPPFLLLCPEQLFMDDLQQTKSRTIIRPWTVPLEALARGVERAGGVRRKEMGTS